MAEAFLTITDLHKSFNSYKAVNGVSFSIDKGEIFGLPGPNGAGNKEKGTKGIGFNGV